MARRIGNNWLNRLLEGSAHDPLVSPETPHLDLEGRWAAVLGQGPGVGRMPALWQAALAGDERGVETSKGEGKDAAAPFAAPTQPDGEGPQFVGDAIGDNTSSTATIAVGASLSSVIDHGGDLDYIKVNLVAGQTYTFSLEGGTLLDPYLELRDASGAVLNDGSSLYVDDGGIGRDSFLVYHATTTGEHWIVARHWSAGTFDTGSYTLSVDSIASGNTSPTTFTPNGKPFFSWDEAAIQITRSGHSWASAFDTPLVITYAYRSTAPATMPEDTTGFSRFNAAQIAATESALAAWAAVANITFQRVDAGDGYSNNAAILFGNYSDGADGAAAFAFLPSNANTSPTSVEGDVWVNVTLAYNANPIRGDYGYQVMLHEIGHALGLRHPGDYNAGEGSGPIEYPTHAEYFQDSRVFTVMTYFGSPPVGGALGAFASLPQMHDIAAIQRLYGANLSTRTGANTYGYNSNTGIAEYTLTGANAVAVFTIWDAGGIDTLDLSGYTTANTIDLREEAFSSVGGSIYNISIARGVVIENAIGGSGADILIGNDAANTIVGGNGADTITGGLGADTIDAGAGDDTIRYTYGDGIDASVNGGSGTDTLIVAGNEFGQTLVVVWTGAGFSSYSGGPLASIEQMSADMGGGEDTLRYTGSSTGVSVNLATGAASGFVALAGVENVYGTDFSDTLNGDAGANRLEGEAGDDLLAGAGGADLLNGGAGADAINGGDGADNIIGGLGDDTIDAGAGDDTIQYAYRDGVDTTDGGSGTDTLVVTGNGNGQTLVVVWTGTGFTSFKGGTLTSIEQMSVDMQGGVDSLRFTGSSTGISVNLAAGTATGFIAVAGVENIYGAAFNDNLTGDGGANRIEGDAGDDTIDAGAGNDVIVGGLGNDTIDAGAGDDIVRWTFGDGSDAIEGGAGTDALVIFGNGNSQTLDVIWTGSGFATFEGGAISGIEQARANLDEGNDTLSYAGSSAGVSVNIATSSATGFTDILGLENAVGGEGADSLTGNAGANMLVGNGGDDTLTGFAGSDTLIGGAGNDTLIGGNDADVYVFQPGSGADTIQGFDADPAGGQDLMRISGYGITADDFAARVSIVDQGNHTLVTIDGDATILLLGVNGLGANVVTIDDFLLAG